MGLHRHQGFTQRVLDSTEIHSAGGGASVEAPPWRPGHVGHTPQPLVRMILGNRLAGILSSATARTPPREFAAQNFQRPQHFEQPGHVATLLALEDFKRRRSLPHALTDPVDLRH